jgi:hypothetical protein
MWHDDRDNDIIDFALLWEPLGGPSPNNVAAAFVLDIEEYEVRLRAAVKSKLARLDEAVTSSDPVYSVSTIASLIREHQQESAHSA